MPDDRSSADNVRGTLQRLVTTLHDQAAEQRKSGNINDSVAAINHASGVARTLMGTLVLVMVYLLVLGAQTTHEVLLRGSTIQLPLLGVGVSVVWFYTLAGPFLIIQHSSFLLQLKALAEKIRGLRQELADQGASEAARHQVFLRLHSFPVTAMLFFERRRGYVPKISAAVVFALCFAGPLLVLLWLQIRFLPYQHDWLVDFQRVLIAVDVVLMLGLSHSIGLFRSWSATALEYATAAAALVISVVLLQPIDGFADPIARWTADRSFVKRSIVVPEEVLMAREPDAVLLSRMRAELHDDINADLQDAELRSFADREHAVPLDLRGRNLRNAILGGTNLSQVRLAGADLRDAMLGGAILRRGRLHEARLERADLSGADLQDAVLIGADLTDADLRFAKLVNADLHTIDGKEPKITRLERSDLRHADLRGARLAGAHLQCADLTGADLRGSNLSGAQLGGARLHRVLLDGADLTAASFESTPEVLESCGRQAELGNSSLFGVDLRGARICGLELTGPNNVQSLAYVEPSDASCATWDLMETLQTSWLAERPVEFQGKETDSFLLVPSARGAPDRPALAAKDVAQQKLEAFESKANAYLSEMFLDKLLQLTCGDPFIAKGVARRLEKDISVEPARGFRASWEFQDAWAEKLRLQMRNFYPRAYRESCGFKNATTWRWRAVRAEFAHLRKAGAAIVGYATPLRP